MAERAPNKYQMLPHARPGGIAGLLEILIDCGGRDDLYHLADELVMEVDDLLPMLLGTQWYILFNVIAGAMAIPTDLKEASSVFRFSKLDRWRMLILPGIFPYLVTGMVTAAGGAWNASIVAEYVRYRGETLIAPGLGSLITEATAAGNFPLLAAGVLTMSLALVTLNRTLWKRLYRVADERFSLNR
jgi:NitT/TauT family transport system permease protein